MMNPRLHGNLARLMAPRHIAFVGGNDAEIAIGEAHRIGFAGEIWPVNPHRAAMGGHRCHSHVSELPEPPDAVFLAVPASAAVETVAQLAALGAGGIVCYSAGFDETGTEEGRALGKALVEAAGDLALVGPNCYGMINYKNRSALWPFAHGPSPGGPGAAIITQSGMLSSDITMAQRSLPITHMISCGNQSVLQLEDYISFLIDDPDVKAIGLHIEGLRNVAQFADVADEARLRGIPIIALKTGASAIGSALTVSHTGSLSGSDALYQALFDRTGIQRVHSPATLLETLKFICVAGIPAGNRLAGFTCSGGGAAMLADHAERVGLAFPQFLPNGKALVSKLLPDIATVSNPLDYTTPIWGNSARTGPVFSAAIEALNAEVAVLIQDYPAPGLDESKIFYRADADAFAQAARARNIPAAICATLAENMDAETRHHLMIGGIAPMQGLTETIEAISAATRWSAARSRNRAAPLIAPRKTPALRMLDEGESKKLLVRRTLSVPEAIESCGADLYSAADAIGYPVALKMIGSRIAHKTEAGALMLGIKNEADLASAYVQVVERVRAHDADALSDRFLVEAMAPTPVAETLINLRHHEQFGQILTIGAGGNLVELFADAATCLLPLAADEITSALRSLRIWPLLRGWRNAAAADIDAIINTVMLLSELLSDPSEGIVEIEINPLFCYPKGVLVVDALVWKAEEK
jgi:acyl-CoA synthetase (NDP forming)